MKRLFLFIALAISLFAGCEKDDNVKELEVNTESISFYYGDKIQIEAVSGREISYKSESSYHATVSKTGLVKAERVGSTNILVSSGEKEILVPVEIKPKQILFNEPDFEWGEELNNVVLEKGNPNINKKSNENTIILEYFEHFDSGNRIVYSYIFDENNKFTMYRVLIKAKYTSQVREFLLERYCWLETKDGFSAYGNALYEKDVTLAIGIEVVESKYLYVYYLPYPIKKSKSGIKKDNLFPFDLAKSRIVDIIQGK